jgi:hypothetical protein
MYIPVGKKSLKILSRILKGNKTVRIIKIDRLLTEEIKNQFAILKALQGKKYNNKFKELYWACPNHYFEYDLKIFLPGKAAIVGAILYNNAFHNLFALRL